MMKLKLGVRRDAPNEVPRRARTDLGTKPYRPEDQRRIRIASAAGLVVGGFVTLLALFDWGTGLGRTALGLGFASNFFDLQAEALSQGKLDVPSASLALEGFVHNGKTYMYFGPFPALLRMPIQYLTHDFDGHLSVLSMLVAWIVLAVFATRLVWLVRRCLLGGRAVTATHAVVGGVLIAAVTGATSLTFNNALPWVYHEVYSWQTAMAVASAYLMVRIAWGPSRRLVCWLFVTATALTLTRTTGGLGICLGIFALALWFQFGHSTLDRRRWAPRLAMAGAGALIIAMVINYLKFEHLYMFPLEDQVWTSLSQQRRDALAANDGSLVGMQFFTTSLATYFGTSVRFTDYFPWISFPAEPAQAVGSAVIDQSYRTGSITAFMPLFLLLSILALVVLLRPVRGQRNAHGVLALRAPMLGVFLMTAGVMAYGYLAYRYTGDFVPALIVGSIIGTWGVLVPLTERFELIRIPLVSLMILGTAWGMVANLAVGFTTAATTGLGEQLTRYVSLQNKLSGGPGTPFARLIQQGPGMPPEQAATDSLWIRGQCDGLYLNTGDAYAPWVTVEERSQNVTIKLPRRMRDGATELFEVRGTSPMRVLLETRENGQMRVRSDNGNQYLSGEWFTMTSIATLRVGIQYNSSIAYQSVVSEPGGQAWAFPATDGQEDSKVRIAEVHPAVSETTRDPDTGVTVTPGRGFPPELCATLVQNNAIDVDLS